MFPVFAVERAKTGFVLSPVTGLLCVKRAQNMRCKFRGKCVIFSFVFLRGLFMRLRARRNGKGTHEGCLCCIFARCRGQKHRGNTFLMPLFGGAGQTGEGREGQTGVEENTGVSGLGRVLLILGCGGGVVVIRTSQRFALCGTADGTGLGGGVGGVFPVVFRLVNLRMADRSFMPVVVHIALPFGCGIGVACHIRSRYIFFCLPRKRCVRKRCGKCA